jgi:hypothetical protein
MRKYLLAAALFASTLSIQTTVLAQPAPDEGSRAYCEARWARMVSAGTTRGETEAGFMDRCMSCDAKFKEMMGSGQGKGDRSAYMRRCTGGEAYNGRGYGAGAILVSLGILGGVGYALSTGGDNNHDDVSP